MYSTGARLAPPINRGTLLVEGASGEAPFSRYKEILALACSGTWFERGGELILAQTPGQATERRDAARRRRIDSLGARLKELAGRSGTELGPQTVEEATQAASMLQLPSTQVAELTVNGRFLEQALARLDWGAANVARGSADASELSPLQMQALVRALMSGPHMPCVGKDVRQVEPSEWRESSLVGVLGWERLQTYCLSFSGDGMITPPLDMPTVADALAGRTPFEQELNRWFDVIANKTYSSIAVVRRRFLQVSFDGSGFSANAIIDSSLIEGSPVHSLEELPSSVLSLIKKAPLN